MTRRSLILLACLLLWAPLALAQDGASVDIERTQAFVEEMLRGIGAERNDCDEEVREQVRVHGLQVMCASFEGDFRHFQTRWDLQLLRIEAFREIGRTDPDPVALPQTDWEPSGPAFARIYHVEGSALGVRFDSGLLLMVW